MRSYLLPLNGVKEARFRSVGGRAAKGDDQPISLLVGQSNLAEMLLAQQC